MLTENEKKVLKIILMAFGEEYSINQIAKQCKIAPNGAMKILKKLERENIIKPKNIANIKSYKINFEDEKTKSILELALISEIKGRLKYRYGDIKQLKELVDACIIFGSYTDLKKEPNDLDLLLVIKKDKFKEYKKKSKVIYVTMPIKIHEVLQTESDIKKNLSIKDKILIEILRTGLIFWGNNKIIEIIENEYQG
jgi:DNA-binding Lrp family transcriptional regulator